MKLDLLLRVGVKLIFPFILLFAFYVQLHGEYGPGGGFQAGVIAAGAIILLALVFGITRAKEIAPQRVVELGVPAGALLYAGTGIVGMLQGNNFLNYTGFASDYLAAHVWGIIIVEVGVLITVASTMLALFYAFTDRGR